jgi:hypothetical protein
MGTSTSKTFLITVPHGYCPESTVRICDRNAYNAATILRTELIKRGANVVFIHNDNVLRSTVDMNRLESRKEEYEFRQNITKQLNILPRDTIVLDIHSYPDIDHFNNREMAILNVTKEYRHTLTNWVENMYQFLKDKGISVGLFQGSLINDIVYQALWEFGFRAVLLEFWENDINENIQYKINIICDYLFL